MKNWKNFWKKGKGDFYWMNKIKNKKMNEWNKMYFEKKKKRKNKILIDWRYY